MSEVFFFFSFSFQSRNHIYNCVSGTIMFSPFYSFVIHGGDFGALECTEYFGTEEFKWMLMVSALEAK